MVLCFTSSRAAGWFALVTLVVACSGSAAAQLCQEWGEPVTLGALDPDFLPEASGVAASERFPGRLYHVNDSGDGPFFYLTDMRGARTLWVRVEGFDASGADVEDLALGPCGAARCLFIADIGDNLMVRDTLQVLLVDELERYAESSPLRARVTLAYPDGPHDAEGFAVHPSGDFYLLTKARVRDLRAAPARLYRLSHERWQDPRGTERLEFVGEIDLRALSGIPIDLLSHIATALDISPDGERLLVLSYGHAYEIMLEGILEGRELELGRDFNRIALRRLPQQESVAYLPGARSFVYSTELRGSEAELVRVDCLVD